MKISKIVLLILSITFCFTLTSCGKSEEAKSETTYQNITAEEAKEIMDTESDYIILDVRSQEEYDEGHIKNAICIPDTEIIAKAEEALTDKNQLILVYCRSGRRSKLASKYLVSLGYTNIKEFGGIIDWPYEIEK